MGTMAAMMERMRRATGGEIAMDGATVADGEGMTGAAGEEMIGVVGEGTIAGDGGGVETAEDANIGKQKGRPVRRPFCWG